MQPKQPRDVAYRPKDIPLNGRLITFTSPSLIGDNDFSDLTNFVYTVNGIKTMNGMISLSSSSEHAIRTMVTADLPEGKVIVYQTYPNISSSYTDIVASCLYAVSSLPSDYSNPSTYKAKRILAYHYRSSYSYTAGQVVLYQSTIQRPSSFYLECITSGTTGSSPPDFNQYSYNTKITDGTVVWIKRKGSLEGQLTVAPDNTVVFTNGHTNLIYGGDQHRAGTVVNVLSTERVINGDFTSSEGWTFETGWSYDDVNHEADKSETGTGALKQSISITSGEQYVLRFTVKNYSSGGVTPYIGGTAGTAVNANGSYTQVITAGSTGELKFVPTTGTTVLSIDDVSVKPVVSRKEIDITNQLTDESYNSYATLVRADRNKKVYLDIGSPLKIRKLNIYIRNPNTVSSTVSIYRYTSLGWTPASNITDGTNGFSQSGTISFSFSGDAVETSELPDVPAYLYNRHLYWYRIELSSSSDLSDNISLYYISCGTVIQAVPNLWDGVAYIPAAFWKQHSDGSLTDHTISVSRRDTILIYDGTTLVPSPETTVELNGVDTIYIGSLVRCTGFRFLFALSTEDKQYVNTAANTMSVYYWNGVDWVLVSGLIDETSNGTSSFARDGVVYFVSSPQGNERTTVINTGVPLYYYKVKFSNSLNSSNGVYLDYVETIPATRTLDSYKSCTIWNNRLILAGNNTTSGKSNEIIISAPSSPYIWMGSQSISLNVGDVQDIVRVVVLFSRYGTDVTEALIVFKERSIYYISGSTQDDIKVYTVSNSIGTSSPYTVAVCDLGIRITEGINRAIIIFANKSGVYLFDNSSIISISDDILDKFQSPLFEEACKYASGIYDVVNSRYHLFYSTGSLPNLTYYEYIFDLVHKKWTSANRGSHPLIYGGILYDTYGNPYLIGFTNNHIAKLNTGNKMIDTPYTATFTTGIKPLGDTLYAISNIRMVKLTSTPRNNTSATLYVHCIDENSMHSSTSFNFSLSSPNDSCIVSPVQHTSIMGNFFYYTLSIPLNSTDSNSVQPINISVLFKPIRIDFV